MHKHTIINQQISLPGFQSWERERERSTLMLTW